MFTFYVLTILTIMLQPIKPMLIFNSNRSEALHDDGLDMKTGKCTLGAIYWNTSGGNFVRL